MKWLIRVALVLFFVSLDPVSVGATSAKKGQRPTAAECQKFCESDCLDFCTRPENQNLGPFRTCYRACMGLCWSGNNCPDK